MRLSHHIQLLYNPHQSSAGTSQGPTPATDTVAGNMAQLLTSPTQAPRGNISPPGRGPLGQLAMKQENLSHYCKTLALNP